MEDLVQQLTEGALRGHKSCSPSEVATLCSSLGRLKLNQPHLLSALLSHCGPQLSSFTPRDLCNTLGGAVSAGYQPDAQWVTALLVAAEQKLTFFSPQELASIILSLANVNCRPHSQWMRRYLGLVREKMSAFTPQDLANTIWGVATLSVVPSERWLSAFASEARGKLSKFSAQGLANTIWALGKMEWKASWPWLLAFCKVAGGRILPGASEQMVVNTLWGLARVGADKEMLEPFIQSAYQHVESLGCRGLTTLVSAMIQVGASPPPGILESLGKRAVILAPALSSVRVVSIVSGLATLKYQPSEGWSQRYLAVSLQLLNRFSPEELSSLLSSFVSLGVTPGPEWVRRFQHRVDEQQPLLGNSAMAAIEDLLQKVGSSGAGESHVEELQDVRAQGSPHSGTTSFASGILGDDHSPMEGQRQVTAGPDGTEHGPGMRPEAPPSRCQESAPPAVQRTPLTSRSASFRHALDPGGVSGSHHAHNHPPLESWQAPLQTPVVQDESARSEGGAAKSVFKGRLQRRVRSVRARSRRMARETGFDDDDDNDGDATSSDNDQ